MLQSFGRWKSAAIERRLEYIHTAGRTLVKWLKMKLLATYAQQYLLFYRPAGVYW